MNKRTKILVSLAVGASIMTGSTVGVKTVMAETAQGVENKVDHKGIVEGKKVEEVKNKEIVENKEIKKARKQLNDWTDAYGKCTLTTRCILESGEDIIIPKKAIRYESSVIERGQDIPGFDLVSDKLKRMTYVKDNDRTLTWTYRERNAYVKCVEVDERGKYVRGLGTIALPRTTKDTRMVWAPHVEGYTNVGQQTAGIKYPTVKNPTVTFKYKQNGARVDNPTINVGKVDFENRVVTQLDKNRGIVESDQYKPVKISGAGTGVPTTKPDPIKPQPQPKPQPKPNSNPTITGRDIAVNQGEKFDLGMLRLGASDLEDGDITDKIKIVSSDVDTSKVGTYTVKVEVTDKQGGKDTKQYRVIVKPVVKPVEKNTAPAITGTDVTLTEGETFRIQSLNIKATDKEDGNLTDKVKVMVNTVDSRKPGDYLVRVAVEDSKGAKAVKDFKVTVKAKEKAKNTSPSITGNDVVLNQGDKFDLAQLNVKATDKEDGNLSDRVIVVENNVNTKKPGKYSVKVSVTDKEGLTVYRTFEVRVNPVIKAKTLDDLYKEAYTATMKCLKVGTQESIKEARKAIGKLPKSLNWAIGEFSKKVDTKQHPIFVQIIKNITKANKTKAQADINEGRKLVKDVVEDIYKNTWSADLDKIQQQKIEKLVNMIEQLKKNKDNSKLMENVKKEITDLKTIKYNDGVKQWLNEYLKTINITIK